MIAKDKTSLIYELRAPTWQSQTRKSPAEDESENKKKNISSKYSKNAAFQNPNEVGKEIN